MALLIIVLALYPSISPLEQPIGLVYVMYEPLTSGFSAFAFVGFVMCLIPFYWHAKAGNAATCLYMFWAAIGCLNHFINSCIWHGNVRNPAPVWCDISTRIIIAENVAMPVMTFCIARQVYTLTSIAGGAIVNKRRETLIDLSAGFGIPLLQVALSYIVQGHRFNIVEDFGCWPAIDDVPPAFALIYIWPAILALLAAFYGSFATYRVFSHGRELANILSIDRAHRGRYIRLTILASAAIFISIPMVIYSMRASIMGVQPWVSWQSVHSDFSAVYVTPASVWKHSTAAIVAIEVTRWEAVLCAFMFFALFGTFSHEACERYRSAYQFTRSRVGQLATQTAVSLQTSQQTFAPGMSIIDVESGVVKPRAAFMDVTRSHTFSSLDTQEKTLVFHTRDLVRDFPTEP
ncbi:STE3-domain-containing protein [Artomyces pyxidatus]|uniref:STE3-domain-containing protein n=1 Tax=Artomyces pyxidatus TaxID=48021 RepID=A0ACB8SZJ7_9AGAM|nr:STE3-domain-containing protein [Artomyces pyxidatus]